MSIDVTEILSEIDEQIEQTLILVDDLREAQNEDSDEGNADKIDGLELALRNAASYGSDIEP